MGGASHLRDSVAARLRAARERLGLASNAQPPRTILTLDRISVRGRSLHGWGWALHPTRRIAALTLERAVEGGQSSLAAEYGFPRPDVEPRFPDAPNGAGVGFVVYGVAKRPIAPGDSLRFVVDFADGGREELVVPAVVTFLDGEAEAKRAGLAKLRRYGREGTALLRGISPFAQADEERPEAVAHWLGSGGPIVLMIDHDLGGGANVFRRRFIASTLKEGARVVLVRWCIANLSYAADVHVGPVTKTVRFFDQGSLERWLDGLGVGRVVLNDVVSYPAPLSLLCWLSSLVARSGARLTVFVHDFEAVCPSWTLLDERGEFCGVPEDRARCEACYAAIRVPFKSVLGTRSVAEWRVAWGRVLASAVEIRCFSESSKTLVRRAYPELDEVAITVVPHRLEHVANRPVRFDVHAPIRIGVVGELSPHKGSDVVRALAAAIRGRGADVGVTVIGTLGADVKAENVAVTGRYAQGDLPELLERHGINVCLFPSIWPETFSYVCEELMQMGLPVVAFDLGAPAERLRRYARGCVVPQCEASELLDRITLFIDELRARDGAVAAP